MCFSTLGNLLLGFCMCLQWSVCVCVHASMRACVCGCVAMLLAQELCQCVCLLSCVLPSWLSADVWAGGGASGSEGSCILHG